MRPFFRASSFRGASFIVDCEASRIARPRELFLSYENGKDIKVVLNFLKFLFFLVTYCSKNLHFASATVVPILAIGLGKKIKKNANCSHF